MYILICVLLVVALKTQTKTPKLITPLNKISPPSIKCYRKLDTCSAWGVGVH